jgi:16S rRNA (cytosine967-C5)-methyltransferase
MAHPPHRNPPRARVVIAPAPQPRGFAARLAAADILDAVLRRGRPLDEQLDEARASPAFAAMEDRDRALVRRIVATVLRRLGTLRALLKTMLQKGLPADAYKAETALLIGAAQILWLKVPDHAAVDLSVRLVQTDRKAERYTGLVNAILRRIIREGGAVPDDALHDTPSWLLRRWTKTYGADGARDIARANQNEPPLDVTVKSDAQGWAEKLEGRVLPTGSVRLLAHGPVTLLPGFAEGAWWVQDTAATLPVRLLGDVTGLKVADLCAAPGGKTAQLALAGAHVTAVDRSEARLARLRDNLKRLSLEAETIAADATQWRPDTSDAGPFDAVLLDAPCSSTGTIRRHPDIPWVKREADFATLTALQQCLLAHAVSLVRPGGMIVYCTCSLEPEEGEGIVAAALAADPALRRVPITPEEIGGLTGAITADGDLRTRPTFLPDPDPAFAGLDGFYAARLIRD